MRKSYLLTLRNPVGGEVVAYVNASGPKAAAFVVDVALKPLKYLNTPLSTSFKVVGVEEWSHGKSRVLSGAKRFGLYYHHSAMRGEDVVQGVAGIKTAINAYMKMKEYNYSPNMVYFLYDLDEYKRPLPNAPQTQPVQPPKTPVQAQAQPVQQPKAPTVTQRVLDVLQPELNDFLNTLTKGQRTTILKIIAMRINAELFYAKKCNIPEGTLNIFKFNGKSIDGYVNLSSKAYSECKLTNNDIILPEHASVLLGTQQYYSGLTGDTTRVNYLISLNFSYNILSAHADSHYFKKQCRSWDEALASLATQLKLPKNTFVGLNTVDEDKLAADILERLYEKLPSSCQQRDGEGINQEQYVKFRQIYNKHEDEIRSLISRKAV